MRYLNGKEIIDSALTVLKNNSAPIRTKMLTWLNVMSAKLEVERAWTFLGNKSATLTPASNVITLPSDYGTFDTLRADGLFLTPSHRLTEYEAWQADNSSSGASAPVGFTEGAVSVTTYGVASDTIVSTGTLYLNTLGIYIIMPSEMLAYLPPGFAVVPSGVVDLAITLPLGTTINGPRPGTYDTSTIKQREIILAMHYSYAVTLSNGAENCTVRIAAATEVENPAVPPGDISLARRYVLTLPYNYSEIYTTSQPILTMHGATITAPVQIGYTVQPSLLTDTTTPSTWPSVCLPVFVRGLLDAFYEYDMDERAANSYSLNQMELSKLKAWDNLHKPKSQPNRHGYRRTR